MLDFPISQLSNILNQVKKVLGAISQFNTFYVELGKKINLYIVQAYSARNINADEGHPRKHKSSIFCIRRLTISSEQLVQFRDYE